MKNININIINTACKTGKWDLGNEVLYSLCREYPFHKKDGEIIAKVWLIGRSYAASIERRKNAKSNNEEFYESEVVPAIKNSNIDSWLSITSKLQIPGSEESVLVHKKLMDLFASISGHNNRSLASKYLHFHQPKVFFIYDSRARNAITEYCPKLNKIEDINTKEFDKEYKDFVRKCVWLRGHIKSLYGLSLKPREIDNFLLG
ncbi:MAG: hypothetical protein PHI86_07365 [Candidatus Omnitrophica bacterium]|nr:hypothetical protein [Candidatus Omnitrophota bacterium]HOX53842.1 hypothetical protein [Candidatus Omnitrophota bacterium]